MARTSFFDEIETNKRDSLLLLFGLSLVLVALVFAGSYLLDTDPVCTSSLALVFVLFYSITVYFAGDRVILATAGAKEVKREEQPFLYHVVEGLAIASNIPKPKVYIVNDPSPNAFATGRDPEHASVAVTTGLLKILKKEELEGVIAHEISHIGNYDIRFMMIAIVFMGAIILLARTLGRGVLYGSGRRRGKSGILVLAAVATLILAPIVAMLIRFAISRRREYLADANAARLTRYPPGLASALEKIEKAGIPTRNANDITASLYISNPLKKGLNLFSTHPSTSERIKRLRSM